MRRATSGSGMFRRATPVCLALGMAGTAAAQPSAERPPVIDMHAHSTTTTPAGLARLDSLGVRFVFLGALATDLPAWRGADSARVLTALVFPCEGGRAVITGRPCFEPTAEFPDPAWLRAEIIAGRVRGFGELLPQFMGLEPNDVRLEPYWQIAEEFGLPVGIHLGPGPAGVVYETLPVPRRSPHYRAALGDPLLLEKVLVRHPRLRLFVMHAGWPRLDAMLALLQAHPTVHVDLAGLHSPLITTRAEFDRYLRTLVDAGFGRRIMFGSDFPDALAPGIAAIREASYLTAAQQADILCGNAARFLRLPDSTCAP